MLNQLKSLANRLPVLRFLRRGPYLFMVQQANKPKWRRLAREAEIRLELGSGAVTGEGGWTTVDMVGADIRHDLRRGIPLADNSVEAIYSSHLLEHIPYPQLIPFLEECHRVLKPGGTFSVCVPNAGKYIKAYVTGESAMNDLDLHEPGLTETGSRIDQVNYIAYMGGIHAYMFDEENLVKTLAKGGFQKAQLRPFDPALDRAERDYKSIYAVATK